ncbi:MAG: metallophosphoesterase [Reinekea sp.]
MSTDLHLNQHHYHLQLTENVKGRDFIVSDLHGFRSKLDSLLKQVKFSYAHDRLISVGDLIDRGPESIECLYLIDEPWFWAVRGNHEQMLINAISLETDTSWSQWILNGGKWSLGQPKDELTKWAESLTKLPLTISLPCQNHNIGICHAEYVQPHWDQRYLETENLIWGRSRLHKNNETWIDGVDWVFSGHTIVPDVRKLGNSVFIERGAYLNHDLTLINLQQWLTSELP